MMTRSVVLLKGINVGGRNKVPMADLGQPDSASRSAASREPLMKSEWCSNSTRFATSRNWNTIEKLGAMLEP